MTPEQRLHWRIVHRHKEGVEADIDEIINRSLMPLRGLPPVPRPNGGGEPSRHETAVKSSTPSCCPP